MGIWLLQRLPPTLRLWGWRIFSHKTSVGSRKIWPLGFSIWHWKAENNPPTNQPTKMPTHIHLQKYVYINYNYYLARKAHPPSFFRDFFFLNLDWNIEILLEICCVYIGFTPHAGRNRHHQDDITFLGSGMPTNLPCRCKVSIAAGVCEKTFLFECFWLDHLKLTYNRSWKWSPLSNRPTENGSSEAACWDISTPNAPLHTMTTWLARIRPLK